VGDKIDITQASSLLRRAGNLPGKKIVKLLLHHLAIYQRLVICAWEREGEHRGGPPSRPLLCQIALRRYAIKFALFLVDVLGNPMK
jgi:hypothetical protein